MTCLYTRSTRVRTFRTVDTTSEELAEIWSKHPGAVVVIEACSNAGWGLDRAVAAGPVVNVATPRARCGSSLDSNSYHAECVCPEVLELAKESVGLLTAFRGADPLWAIHVSPGRAGGVLIEWADARSEHELELEPDGTWGFLHTERVTK
ncbi:hypothetical protein [Frigoriglobus tundricola]|uniref:hypothetical protein n=1 Tax=Frigoriglobus tundricola TaxID=2774151 RepID=UPI00148EA454|nr:hypothetical protein [Frigoriglobus tundricola]